MSAAAAPVFAHPHVARVAPFLESLGIHVVHGEVPPGTFLPGLRVRGNTVVVHPPTLKFPTDVLHEAAHIALMTPEQRADPDTDVPEDPALEMASMAWSYAAGCAVGLAARDVFHDGYKAGGAAMAQAFESGGGPGIPMLAFFGMTREPHQARRLGLPGFPHMLRWLR